MPLVGKATVKAIHYIQSFADEENVPPELAHDIAKAFVRKAYDDKLVVCFNTREGAFSMLPNNVHHL